MFRVRIVRDLFFAVVFLSQITAWAESPESRGHGAHVHGAATLAVAFEGLSGRVEFKAASEGVLGFEHEARSEKDKKKVEAVRQIFEKDISKMIQFDFTLGCVWSSDKIQVEAEAESDHDHEKEISKSKKTTPAKKTEKSHPEKHQGEHSDFVANYQVKCSKPILATSLKLDFTRFEHLADIDVTLLVGDIQKSVELKKKPLVVELKK